MLTSILFSIIVWTSRPQRFSEEARLPLVSPDRSITPLAGHVVVFTGKLSSLGRKEARALVAIIGEVLQGGHVEAIPKLAGQVQPEPCGLRS